jgi:hypothetical protein
LGDTVCKRLPEPAAGIISALLVTITGSALHLRRQRNDSRSL